MWESPINVMDFEWESEKEKRQNFAKQILDYLDKQGTEQTILFLKDIAEDSEV